MDGHADAGSVDEPDPVVERVAARVLLVDGHGRVLLFRGRDPARPDAGDWWFTPGGGVEPGESLTQAARREVLEETGQLLPEDLGPVVFRRTARFSFEGLDYRQDEHYFRVTASHSQVDYSGWTEIERRAVHAHRWWTAGELHRTTETVYPEGLVDLLRGNVPE